MYRSISARIRLMQIRRVGHKLLVCRCLIGSGCRNSTSGSVQPRVSHRTKFRSCGHAKVGDRTLQIRAKLHLYPVLTACGSQCSPRKLLFRAVHISHTVRRYGTPCIVGKTMLSGPAPRDAGCGNPCTSENRFQQSTDSA